MYKVLVTLYSYTELQCTLYSTVSVFNKYNIYVANKRRADAEAEARRSADRKMQREPAERGREREPEVERERERRARERERERTRAMRVKREISCGSLSFNESGFQPLDVRANERVHLERTRAMT